MNFKNFNDATTMDQANIENMQRQHSIYSLTFDEFQNTLNGQGKEFGSMNMDELLKNIWSVEEGQTSGMTMSSAAAAGNNLQKQGSLKLPRTISQKTVDEVFRDLTKESGPASGGNGSNMPQRQPTLREITLEEFLVRAGVVREDMQQVGRAENNNNDNGGLYGDLMRQNNNNSLAIDFQQQSRNAGLLPNSSNQPPLFPKQTNLAFATPMQLMNTSEPANGRARARAEMVGPPMKNLVQASGLQSGGIGMVGGATVGAQSPASKLSPGMIGKCSVDMPSLSPVPYAFGRGRKSSPAVEKVVERRQRRMIKNRESASRSRARKQAYTLELEAEVANLKELNQELQKKQAEIVEMQKDQLMEKMNGPWGNKQQCLRRTLTGPW